MPIHIRAEPGEYAEACLLPGDPLRAKCIAETYFDDVRPRNSKRGVLAVEMEASALFTVGALRGVQAGCLLTVSDIVVEGEFKRITDDELRGAVDRMTQVALATVTADKGH